MQATHTFGSNQIFAANDFFTYQASRQPCVGTGITLSEAASKHIHRCWQRKSSLHCQSTLYACRSHCGAVQSFGAGKCCKSASAPINFHQFHRCGKAYVTKNVCEDRPVPMLVLVVAGTEEGFFSTSKKASESTAETSRESWCLRSDQRFKFMQACRE